MDYLPVSPAGRRYGRFPDNPKHPARSLRALLAKPTITLPPTAMELVPYKGPTRDQKQAGTCTGQAGSEKLDLDYRQFSDWQDRSIDPAQFKASASFIYKCNLIADGDLGTDAGSSLHQTAPALKRWSPTMTTTSQSRQPLRNMPPRSSTGCSRITICLTCNR